MVTFPFLQNSSERLLLKRKIGHSKNLQLVISEQTSEEISITDLMIKKIAD